MPFPGFQNKHDEEPYFTPADWAEWRRGQGDLDGFVCPESVVLVYDNRMYRWLGEAPDAQPAGGRALAGLVLLGRTDCRVGVLGGFGYGAPVAAGRMENLIALGVRRFVSFGSAGGLQPDLEVGDLVVCTGAVRDEGVSYHYLPAHVEVWPDQTLTAALRAELSRHGPVKAGRTWTIDAPYRETVAEVHHYRADGVLTVEMEAAALLAVAAVRGVAIASAFCISDLLHRHEWHPDFNSPKLLKGLSALADAAVSTLEGRPEIGAP
jgi:uridine phosphorylase